MGAAQLDLMDSQNGTTLTLFPLENTFERIDTCRSEAPRIDAEEERREASERLACSCRRVMNDDSPSYPNWRTMKSPVNRPVMDNRTEQMT